MASSICEQLAETELEAEKTKLELLKLEVEEQKLRNEERRRLLDSST